MRQEINIAAGGSANCAAQSVDGVVQVLVSHEGACGIWVTEHDSGWRQGIANFAAGVANGILLGQGDRLFANMSITAGKYNTNSKLNTAGTITGTAVGFVGGAALQASKFAVGGLYLGASAVSDGLFDGLVQHDGGGFVRFGVSVASFGVASGVGRGLAARAASQSSTTASNALTQAFRNVAANDPALENSFFSLSQQSNERRLVRLAGTPLLKGYSRVWHQQRRVEHIA